MIPQPGHPRNVPEALTGPEDKKNSFGAKKEKAGEIPVIISGQDGFWGDVAGMAGPNRPLWTAAGQGATRGSDLPKRRQKDPGGARPLREMSQLFAAILQGGYGGQQFAFQQFQGGTAAGGDVAHFVGQAVAFHSGHG